jgi:hypothetical protein
MPPVPPDCEGLAVCVLEFEGLDVAVVTGLAVPVALLVALPPVAVMAPVVWVKFTVSKFCEVPPVTNA